MRKTVGVMAGVLMATAILASAPLTGPAGAAGSGGGQKFTGAPLTIALITSKTGLAAPLFQEAPQGFLARIALQNANGGVNGHKLIPLVIDDQTNPSLDATGVQLAISRGAIGIVNDSALFYSGYKYAQQAGVPVTGSSLDGPEWGQQPNTNMFASDTGSVDPKYPANTAIGAFLKAHGGTNVGTYGISISPSSISSAIATGISFTHAGGKVGVLDTSVPFGSVDFTSAALTAKSKKINAVYAGMGNNQNFALATALKQAGVKLKAVVFPTGYEADVIHTPAWRSLQGMYFGAQFRPTVLPNAGTRQLASALQKYQHRSPANFPTYIVDESWAGADLMIKGLQLAGNNPTRGSVVKALRGIKSYNANGLLPQSINFSTIFGHNLPKQCSWYLQARKNGFVPLSSTPVCGSYIPGTATAQH
jgi:ABC-type branched-subunit amino acid transport system substrate-binding protein